MAAKVQGMLEPPAKFFFDVLWSVAYGPNKDKYLLQGTLGPSETEIENDFGGAGKPGTLKRATSLQALLIGKCVTEDVYTQACALDRSIKKPDQLDWPSCGKIVELINANKISFDVTKLVSSGLVQGRNGAPGWWFASGDAETTGVETMKTQLAIHGDYVNGLVVFEMSGAAASQVEHKDANGTPNGKKGARRPTALDLTMMEEGKFNENTAEPAGRTNPQKAGQKEVREVLLPPVTIGQTSAQQFVPAGT
jgi:hypothetical protein